MTLEQIAPWLFAFGLSMAGLWLLVLFARWLGGVANEGERQGRPGRLPVAAQRHRVGIQLGPPRRVENPLSGSTGGIRIRRGLPLIVPVHSDPLWTEKGWRRNGSGYTGQFRAGRLAWPGLIRTPYPGAFDAYIWNPPLAELQRRTHYRPCFQRAPGGNYRVHFHSMPASLDHAIATIEQVLAQAMGVR